MNRQAYVAAQPDGTLQLLAPQARIDAGSDMVARGSLTVQGALIASGAAPTHGNDACQRGQISSDSAFIYVCVADHHWRRSPLADF